MRVSDAVPEPVVRSAVYDLVRRSRPRFWLYLAGPVLVGVAYGAARPADIGSLPALALFAYFLLPANVLLYGVNDVFDADVDAENPKKEGPERRYRGARLTPIAVVASAVLAIPVFAVVPPVGYAPLVGFFALAVAYSAPPARFKTTPPLDSISNGLYVLPGVAAYAAVAGRYPPALAVAGGWLWTMAMHTFSAVPDIEPDRRAGIRTTATALGERGALAYCGACWTLAAACFLALDPRLGAALAVYPPLLIGIAVADVTVDRAYWWFPYVNGAVGAALTLGGLWGLVYG